jgi:hypothetical protein
MSDPELTEYGLGVPVRLLPSKDDSHSRNEQERSHATQHHSPAGRVLPSPPPSSCSPLVARDVQTNLAEAERPPLTDNAGGCLPNHGNTVVAPQELEPLRKMSVPANFTAPVAQPAGKVWDVGLIKHVRPRPEGLTTSTRRGPAKAGGRGMSIYRDAWQ